MQNGEITRIFDKVHIDEPTIETNDISETEGSMVISPLLQGYGTTIGNSLRRVMLSSLPGAAVVSITVSCGGMQAMHEFSTLPGVKEDLCEIILNIKSIVAKLRCDGAKYAYIDTVGPAVIRAGDISCDDELEIVNPGQIIASIGDGVPFHMELKFDHGAGYVSAEKNKQKYDSGRVGELFVDSIFTPVKNVRYTAENTRVGGSMDFDKLEIQTQTNGSITPTQAFIVAAQILREHFGLITALAGVENETTMIAPSEETLKTESLDMQIDALELSVRSYNCLKRAGINTVGELVCKSIGEMKKIRNLGAKSLEEIEKKINDMGFGFKEEE